VAVRRDRGARNPGAADRESGGEDAGGDQPAAASRTVGWCRFAGMLVHCLHLLSWCEVSLDAVSKERVNTV
jgi:hypothetical protein